MVNSTSYSNRYFTIKRVDENMKNPSITTSIRVIDIVELAKTLVSESKLLEVYIIKLRMSRLVAKVADILIKKMVSKDMIILDFKLMDLTNVRFDRDFDWSINIKVNGVDTILEYHISSKSWSEVFTRCFIRKYNKIRR